MVSRWANGVAGRGRTLAGKWLAFICTAVLISCESHHTQPVGGQWAIDYVMTIAPEAGHARGDLVLLRGGKREVVDRYVWAAHYYRHDCVGYWRFVHSRDQIFFACGNRRPLLVGTTTTPDAWQFSDRGIESFYGTSVVGGKALKLGRRYTIASLTAAATRAPLRTSPGESFNTDVASDEFSYDEAGDVNRRDEFGSTALMRACGSGATKATNPAEVRALLDAGADVNAADGAGYTALMFAVDEPEAVKLLLAHGANVNAMNENHTTALIEACRQHGDKVSVRLLIEAGANVNLGRQGNRALSWARAGERKEIVQMLDAAGARE